MKHILTALIAMSFVSLSWAQEQEDSDKKAPVKEKLTEETSETSSQDTLSKKSDDSVEKIEVTGSHIKRINVEGPSPIFTLDREDLDRSGYNSVADTLRETSVNSFGSAREDSGSTTSGTASVSLRGLGASRTLILMNGKRLPSDATNGVPDLNLIPMAAVERIEILKDGASATYGSDALGGVVNIITRKDFNGTELSFKQTVPELKGGLKSELSAVSGFTTPRFNMVGVLYYRDNERVYDRDRDWFKDGESKTGSPGSYQIDVDNTWFADPKCVEYGGYLIIEESSNYCGYNFASRSTRLPELKQASLLTDMTFKVTESLQAYARLGGTFKWLEWVYAPSPGSFTVTKASAIDMGVPGAPRADSEVFIRYRTVELGDRVIKINTDNYSAVTGVKGELLDTWEWDASIYYNRVFRNTVSDQGYALKTPLSSKFGISFNTLSAPGSRGDLSDVTYKPWQRAISEIGTVELKTSGEIFETSSGAWAMAMGLVGQRELFSDSVDEQTSRGEVFGSAGSNGNGDRNVLSFYSELAAPLTSSLEMQLSGRFDNYSDFGSTVNPKVGFRWQASPSWMFRTSIGTGFKAPQMQDLYASDSQGYPTFIDKKACSDIGGNDPNSPSCSPQQWFATSGGNVNLKEEKSISTSLGGIYQPIRNFNIGLDVWYIKLNNVVGIDYEAITEAELLGLNLAERGIIINRTEAGKINDRSGGIVAPLQNLASREVMGLDVSTDFSFHTGIGRFHNIIAGSLLLTYKQEGFPGVGIEEELRQNGQPAWRANYSLIYSLSEIHDFSTTIRFIGGHEKAVEEKGQLSAYAEADIQYNYKPNSFNGIFTFGIRNIAGSVPPLDDTNKSNQLDVSLYDQIGRYGYLAYKHTF